MAACGLAARPQGFPLPLLTPTLLHMSYCSGMHTEHLEPKSWFVTFGLAGLLMAHNQVVGAGGRPGGRCHSVLHPAGSLANDVRF